MLTVEVPVLKQDEPFVFLWVVCSLLVLRLGLRVGVQCIGFQDLGLYAV